MSDPNESTAFRDAFASWCDRAQVVLAIRELRTTGKLTPEDMDDLVSYVLAEADEICWADASSERFDDAEWSKVIDELVYVLHRNFDSAMDFAGAGA